MKTLPTGIRILSLFLSLLCCAILIPSLPAQAADTTVYLDPANGSDSADGSSPAAAFATLPAAIRAAAAGGRIVLMSALSLTGSASEQFVEPAHTGEIVLTSTDGATDYRSAGAVLSLQGGMVYALGGPAVFENLKINTGSGNTVIAARFNPLTMGEGLTMSSTNLILLGGYEGPKKGTPTNRSSSLTVESGSYRLVIGFSRNKGDGNLTYTGTANITVRGGTIGEIYGASTVNHFSGSLSAKIYGGKITTLHTGGDVTRRLNGTSTIEFYDGSVSKLEINNACGDTTVKLDGGTLSSVTELIYGDNDAIKQLAANAKRYLSYNSLSFSLPPSRKRRNGGRLLRGKPARRSRSGGRQARPRRDADNRRLLPRSRRVPRARPQRRDRLLRRHAAPPAGRRNDPLRSRRLLRSDAAGGKLRDRRKRLARYVLQNRRSFRLPDRLRYKDRLPVERHGERRRV